ncbi:hypothetical protein Agub_g14166 [Astrephomene gubernaculifera]|uniref:Methyltransferase type 11 domain-containing protein n=1 Tax=Astrephomene gubernaculifera TaxID=47775 RepID=A0AAD3E117_9CHLO|nr:hypothetical protein Agub_g14166 [Astrephomene gubernaculifera]
MAINMPTPSDFCGRSASLPAHPTHRCTLKCERLSRFVPSRHLGRPSALRASTSQQGIHVQNGGANLAEFLKPSPHATTHNSGGRHHFRGSVASLALAASLILFGDSSAAVQASETVTPSKASLDVQQAYDRYSSKYDDLDGGVAAEVLGFPQLRQALLQQAQGRVLEVAVGTGLNLPYYRWGEPTAAGAGAAAAGAAPSPSQQLQQSQPGEEKQQQQPTGEPTTSVVSTAAANQRTPPAAAASATAVAVRGVTSLDAADLSPGMLDQAQRRVAAAAELSGRRISFVQADVAALPYGDESFDTVVDTFSLCVFPDPQAALREMARVLRPGSSGGRLLLLEHCRAAAHPLLAAYQDLTAGAVAALGKGCVWNQDVEGMVAAAGLQVVEVQRAAAGTVEMLVATK